MLSSWPGDRSPMLSWQALLSMRGWLATGRADFVQRWKERCARQAALPGAWNSSCPEDWGLDDNVWSGTQCSIGHVLDQAECKKNTRRMGGGQRRKTLRTAWLMGLRAKDIRGMDKDRQESCGPPGTLVKVPMQFSPLQRTPLIHSPSPMISLE